MPYEWNRVKCRIAARHFRLDGMCCFQRLRDIGKTPSDQRSKHLCVIPCSARIQQGKRPLNIQVPGAGFGLLRVYAQAHARALVHHARQHGFGRAAVEKDGVGVFFMVEKSIVQTSCKKTFYETVVM